MKKFKNWLVEMENQPELAGMDSAQKTPPPNGGIKPSIPSDIASELSAIAQKLNALIEKLGIGDQEDNPQKEKGLADKGMGDQNIGQPAAPPQF